MTSGGNLQAYQRDNKQRKWLKFLKDQEDNFIWKVLQASLVPFSSFHAAPSTFRKLRGSATSEIKRVYSSPKRTHFHNCEFGAILQAGIG